MKQVIRITLAVCLMCLAALSLAAGTLTVTSPTSGAFLGTSNQIKFTITGASVEVTVKAVVTGPSGSTTLQDTFTPDTDGKISGSLPLNFGQSSPEGAYTITVTATEPGNTYKSTTIPVTVDITAPKFSSYSPISGMFVKSGIVTIRATIDEAHVKDWRVQVNGSDLPNNTGTTNTIAVPWDTTPNGVNGSQTITIVVHDQAGNQATQTINVTVDKVKPVVTIVYPRSDSVLATGTTINVVIDIGDGYANSVDATGLDVLVEQTDGTYIARVSLTSFISTSSTNFRWTGRIRYRRNLIPQRFKIVATALDRAGNVGVPQEVVVSLR